MRSRLLIVLAATLVVATVAGASDTELAGPFLADGPPLPGTRHASLGESIALSADGTIALVGAPSEPRAADPAWAGGEDGAAWVLERGDGGWKLAAKLTRSTGEATDSGFGKSVALSADGATALVGATSQRNDLGGAWVLVRTGSEGTGSEWTRQAELTPPARALEDDDAFFGSRVALSADGDTALVCAPRDGGGSMWFFERTGSAWKQTGPKLMDPSRTPGSDFCVTAALSADGTTAIVGRYGQSRSFPAAFVYVRTSSGWKQQGRPFTAIPPGEAGRGGFAQSVALSGDGNIALVSQLAVDHQLKTHGGVWVFTRRGSIWSRRPTMLGAGHSPAIGRSVAISADGRTVLVGASRSAWVFALRGSRWVRATAPLGPPLDRSARNRSFGAHVALSADGATAFVGATSWSPVTLDDSRGEDAGVVWPSRRDILRP